MANKQTLSAMTNCISLFSSRTSRFSDQIQCKLCGDCAEGGARAQYLLMIWIVRSAQCKLRQTLNNNTELKYHFLASDTALSHRWLLTVCPLQVFISLFPCWLWGANTYFWLHQLNVSLFCLVRAKTHLAGLGRLHNYKHKSGLELRNPSYLHP